MQAEKSVRFLLKSESCYLVLTLEAAHSSLDIFERSPVLITFDSSFEQKIGHTYAPNFFH